jgi:hypothetical protein
MRNFTAPASIVLAVSILSGCTSGSATLPLYSIGGSVSGLPESGSVVLQDNAGDNLTVSADGGFTFASLLPGGASYAVTILTQPAGTICRVSDGTGTLAPDRSVLANPDRAQTNITNVLVACAPTGTFVIGGSVTGLLPGNRVVLTDNGGDGVTVSANKTFTFATQIEGGLTYSVMVGTQPAGQSCAVTNGSGTVGGTVSNIAIACSDNTYNVGAVVSGLVAGATVVLQNNGGDNLIVSSNIAANFSRPVASGSAYVVTVLTSPTGETCAVSGTGSGIIAASNVSVTVVCTPGVSSFTVGGSVSGLLTGHSVVLADNGGDSTTVSSNTNFTFSTPIASGAAYAVTVLTQPTGESCAVTNGTGTVTTSAISNVAVTCSPSGGTLTGAIYVTNSVTNSVLVFAPNPSGTINEAPIAIIAGSNTGLQNPQGIAIDASGRIYVANDVPNSGETGGDPGVLIAGGYITVYAADPHGVLNEAPLARLTPAVLGVGVLPGFPAALAIDASGMIYLASGDFGAGGGGSVSVYAANPSGAFTGTPLGTVNTVSFSFTGVAVDATGKIYAANPFAGANAPPSITVYANPNGTVTGTPLATIAGSNTGLNAPYGVALDANGKIYVANISQNSTPSITVYPANPSGTLNEAPVATIAGSHTGLNAPTSVVVDASGLIYVGNGGGSVTVYEGNPNGMLNEAPIATITGSNTGLSTAGAPLFTQPILGIAVH